MGGREGHESGRCVIRACPSREDIPGWTEAAGEEEWRRAKLVQFPEIFRAPSALVG